MTALRKCSGGLFLCSPGLFVYRLICPGVPLGFLCIVPGFEADIMTSKHRRT